MSLNEKLKRWKSEPDKGRYRRIYDEHTMDFTDFLLKHYSNKTYFNWSRWNIWVSWIENAYDSCKMEALRSKGAYYRVDSVSKEYTNALKQLTLDIELEYWLDANNSITGSAPITSWSDLSGNAITNTINGNPSLTTGSLNGYDVVTFDGSGDFIVTNLSINESVFSNLTVIALYVPRVNNSGGVWGEDNGGWDRFILDGNIGFLNNMVSNGATNTNNITNIFPVGTPVITTVIFQEDVSNGTTVYANNTLQSTFTSNMGPETSNTFKVGEIGASNFRFDGDIAELLVFGTNINTAQRIIIDNYLSAKYGLALTSNDLFNNDDIANGDYDNDVAGIGQATDGTNHTDSRGTGIVRILNSQDLDNDEFLIWGHNNGIQEATEITDVPPTVEARLDRVWRISEVNSSGTAVDVGAIDISFDLTGLETVTNSDLRLLIDTDNDGVFIDETPIAGATPLGNNIYQFTGITAITDNSRFTLGTINVVQTPLPIELISFTVNLLDNKFVKLDWQTVSEMDSDYFTIEHSLNGSDWKELTKISATGNSVGLLDYTTTDKLPSMGTSYYRLKQTDIDGQFQYSEIKKITITTVENFQIYPNPTNSSVTIKGNDIELSEITIYNTLGQNVTMLTQKSILNDVQLVVNLSKLSSGVYYIKTKTMVSKVSKQ